MGKRHSSLLPSQDLSGRGAEPWISGGHFVSEIDIGPADELGSACRVCDVIARPHQLLRGLAV